MGESAGASVEELIGASVGDWEGCNGGSGTQQSAGGWHGIDVDIDIDVDVDVDTDQCDGGSGCGEYYCRAIETWQ